MGLLDLIDVNNVGSFYSPVQFPSILVYMDQLCLKMLRQWPISLYQYFFMTIFAGNGMEATWNNIFESAS